MDFLYLSMEFSSVDPQCRTQARTVIKGLNGIWITSSSALMPLTPTTVRDLPDGLFGIRKIDTGFRAFYCEVPNGLHAKTIGSFGNIDEIEELIGSEVRIK